MKSIVLGFKGRNLKKVLEVVRLELVKKYKHDFNIKFTVTVRHSGILRSNSHVENIK